MVEPLEMGTGYQWPNGYSTAQKHSRLVRVEE